MKTRWRLIGQLTTCSPLHIGTGDGLEKSPIEGKEGAPCDVQAIVKGRAGRPCIPGTALKGVLRSWAEAMLKAPDHQAAIDRIFGKRDIKHANAQSGWAEFCAAHAKPREDKAACEKYVPYWIKESETGIVSHVCIDRTTGAASDAKLFFEEFVPEGTTFDVEINATRLSENDIALLTAILEQGSSHSTHPFQFGANGADGWGRMKWKVGSLLRCDAPIQLKSNQVGFDCCQQKVALPAAQLNVTLPSHISLELTLKCDGPFLVNDTSRTHKKENDDLPNFVPLRRADGGVWLPASSFRGALRERAEFLLRSLDETATGDPNGTLADGPIERIFGQTSHASVLTIQEFKEDADTASRPDQVRFRHQDFVAIDRWTGGAADGAKFDAKYSDSPKLSTKLMLDTRGLQAEDLALLALALRDLCGGKVPLGWGSSKGYGVVTGEASNASLHDLPGDMRVTESLFCGDPDSETLNWMKDALKGFADRHPMLDRQEETAITSKKSSDGEGKANTPPPEKLETGTLVWQGEGKKRKRVLDAGKPLPYQLKADAIRSDLSKSADDQVAVDYVLEKGQPTKIRPRGEHWMIPSQSPTQTALTPTGSPTDEFAHPYYFLHQKDRTGFEKIFDELGDLAPNEDVHRKYIPDRYSGVIRIKLTTETPMILCDQPSDPKSDHLSYPLRLQDGRPLLASSSVRGMLRSAYEAVTNSRFGVFPFDLKAKDASNRQHARKLGYRAVAQDGLGLVPVLVRNGQPQMMLGSGTELPFLQNGRWKIPGETMYAAWVPRYRRNQSQFDNDAIRLNGQPVSHGQSAWCWLELMQHELKHFKFWRVRNAASTKETLGEQPAPSRSTNSYRPLGQMIQAQGIFVVTNQNNRQKHDERFFFRKVDQPTTIGPGVLDEYMELIANCQELHHEEYQSRLALGPAPTQYVPPTGGGNAETPAMSRHTYATGDRDVSAEHLCYAQVERRNNAFHVLALYPVMISRKLFAKSPLDLLPAKLRPATKFSEFSPADRVFGWVSQDDETVQRFEQPAFRSPLRIGPVRCLSDDAVEPCGKALSILGQPKSQQGRFYLGRKTAGTPADGTAQEQGLTKEQSGYHDGNRIRGPKVYPHQQRGVVDQHAFSESLTNQNRTIESQVKVGTTFECDLHVTNLTAFELGGLVWLLNLPPHHFLRLGLAKPLGFGSVRVEIDPQHTRVARGDAWSASLARGNRHPFGESLNPLQERFQKTIVSVHSTLLPSFNKVTSGLGDVPVHYPIVQGQAPNAGETYKWFVANDKRGVQFPLPDLLSSKLLPVLDPP